MQAEVAAWLVVNSVGLVFALWDLGDALIDARIVKVTTGEDAPERVEARHAAWAQAARVATLLGLLSLGVLAAVRILSSVVFRAIMFFVAGVVTADSVRARRHRKRLMQILRSHPDREG